MVLRVVTPFIPTTSLHGVTIYNTTTQIFNAVKISNLTLLMGCR